MLFDFGCYSLAQEMSFVDSYLPYFRQRLITCPLLALLPFQSLFTESSHGDQLLTPELFSGAPEHPAPLCCVSFSVPCLLFSLVFVFVGWGVSLPRGLSGLFQG
jgi:hypothetical protein